MDNLNTLWLEGNNIVANIMSGINDWVADKLLLPLFYFMCAAIATVGGMVWSHEKLLILRQGTINQQSIFNEQVVQLNKAQEFRLYELEKVDAVRDVTLNTIVENQLKIYDKINDL